MAAESGEQQQQRGRILHAAAATAGWMAVYVQQSESAASEGMIVCNKFCAYVCFLQELFSLLSPSPSSAYCSTVRQFGAGVMLQEECEHSSVNGQVLRVLFLSVQFPFHDFSSFK